MSFFFPKKKMLHVLTASSVKAAMRLYQLYIQALLRLYALTVGLVIELWHALVLTLAELAIIFRRYSGSMQCAMLRMLSLSQPACSRAYIYIVSNNYITI